MEQPPPVYEPAALADPASKKPRRRPPVGRRFQPGQSGNPAGRPRRKALPSVPAALERALKGRVTLETGGRPRRISVTDALFETMIARALAGDTAARRDLVKARAELDAAEAARREAARQAREQRALEKAREEAFARSLGPQPAHECGEHLHAALSMIGAGTLHPEWRDYAQYLHQGKVTLDSWVVEAAFARDPGLEDRLDDEQRQILLRAMNGEYSGAYERHGSRLAPKEQVEETPVMQRLMVRVRRYWASRGELFLSSGDEGPAPEPTPDPAPDPAPSAPPAQPPPPAEATPQPAPAAVEEDWVERLARAGRRRGGGPHDWMG